MLPKIKYTLFGLNYHSLTRIIHNQVLIKKIYQVLENNSKTLFVGLGQPEALNANYSGYWSRRINLEHRIIYKVESDKIIVFSLKGHYK